MSLKNKVKDRQCLVCGQILKLTAKGIKLHAIECAKDKKFEEDTNFLLGEK